MGGSSSSSSSSSKRTTTTKTNNLALEDVDGVTFTADLAGKGSDSLNLNITDGGAFDVVNNTIQAAEHIFASSLSTISNQNNQSLEALTKSTIESLAKVNESNQTESEIFAGKFQTVAIAGLIVYGAVTYWKAKS